LAEIIEAVLALRWDGFFRRLYLDLGLIEGWEAGVKMVWDGIDDTGA
jgi:hypothetical protein